jgi:hypothetical protein
MRILFHGRRPASRSLFDPPARNYPYLLNETIGAGELSALHGVAHETPLNLTESRLEGIANVARASQPHSSPALDNAGHDRAIRTARD